ncbi:lymphocyte activation gene 3 protein [Polymixia lowei]
MFCGYYISWGIILLVKGVWGEMVEVFVETGSSAVLPCESKSPSPGVAEIVWTKDNAGIWRKEKNGLEYRGRNWTNRVGCPNSKVATGDYSLHITGVREEDGGVYTCRVDQDVRPVEVTLRVIKVSFSPLASMEGDDLSISCSVTPWPRGATVGWRLNGKPFGAGNQRGTYYLPNGNRILTGKASQALTGNWTCAVTHQRTESLSTRPLSLRGIIHPLNDNARVYAALGSEVTLPCVFSSGLIPSNTTWEKVNAGSPSPSNPPSLPPTFNLSSPSSQHPWDRSVSVREVSSEDEGWYRCSGTAEGHRLTRNLQLVIAKVGRISSTRRAPATLSCDLSDPSEVTNYEWAHVTFDLNGTQSVTSIQEGKVLKFNSATEENAGEWTCRFYGKKGILGNVTYHIHQIGGLTGSGETGTFNNTPTVIGLSFFLVVLLLILAKMYKNHLRRQRTLQFPALEAVVHAISNEREERRRNCAEGFSK